MQTIFTNLFRFFVFVTLALLLAGQFCPDQGGHEDFWMHKAHNSYEKLHRIKHYQSYTVFSCGLTHSDRLTLGVYGLVFEVDTKSVMGQFLLCQGFQPFYSDCDN